MEANRFWFGLVQSEPKSISFEEVEVDGMIIDLDLPYFEFTSLVYLHKIWFISVLKWCASNPKALVTVFIIYHQKYSSLLLIESFFWIQ